MPVETRKVIPVRFSIPHESLLSMEIDFRRDKKGAQRNMHCYRDASLLVELANGFYGKDANGNYISPELRESIFNYKGRGEWTADHVDYDAEIPAGIVVPKGYVRVNWIQLADEIKERNGKYIAEGGARIPVELPENGWQVPVKDGQEFRMYHPAAGSPLATVPFDKKNEAVIMLKEAGFDEKDVSRFYRRDKGNGTAAVCRWFVNIDDGPFYVFAYDDPGSRIGYLGVRLASRAEPLRSKSGYRELLEKSIKFDKINCRTNNE